MNVDSFSLKEEGMVVDMEEEEDILIQDPLVEIDIEEDTPEVIVPVPVLDQDLEEVMIEIEGKNKYIYIS